MKIFYLLIALLSHSAFAGTGRIIDSAVADNAAIKYSKMQTINAHSFLGNNSGSAAVASSMTGTQATALLDVMVGDSGAGGTAGICPAAPAGSAAANKFLAADGTYKTAGSTITTHDFSLGAGLTISSGTGTNAVLQALTVGIAAGYYLPSTTDQTNWNAKQSAITTGTTSQYFRGDLSLSTFASDVIASALTGLSTATSTVVTATDTILVGIGKLQGQISALGTAATHATTDFFQLAGVSGGQTANGGTASGDNLTLHSTANATKGKILAGALTVDEANSRVGVNATSPATAGLDARPSADATGGSIALTSFSGSNSVSMGVSNAGTFRLVNQMSGSHTLIALTGSQDAFTFGGGSKSAFFSIKGAGATPNSFVTMTLEALAGATADILQTFGTGGAQGFSVDKLGYPYFPTQGAGSTPSTTTTGALAFTSAHKLCTYTGSAWVNASDGSTSCTF